MCCDSSLGIFGREFLELVYRYHTYGKIVSCCDGWDGMEVSVRVSGEGKYGGWEGGVLASCLD